MSASQFGKHARGHAIAGAPGLIIALLPGTSASAQAPISDPIYPAGR